MGTDFNAGNLSIVPQTNNFRQYTSAISYGCAACRIMTDDNKTPIDYEIIDINTAFESAVGLSQNELVGHKLSEISSDFKTARFDFLNVFGHVANYDSRTLFYFCTEGSRRWFSASAFSPEKGIFIIMLEDITSIKQQEIKQKKNAL